MIEIPDVISRKEAIDAIMDSETYDKASIIGALEDLPSMQAEIAKAVAAMIEQPKIIRCKDCKYSSPNKVYGCRFEPFDTLENGERMYSDDFCSRAERRTDD